MEKEAGARWPSTWDLNCRVFCLQDGGWGSGGNRVMPPATRRAVWDRGLASSQGFEEGALESFQVLMWKPHLPSSRASCP